MIELYLSEHCPFCRKVRSFMEEASVAYVVKPVLLGPLSNVYKEELIQLGGKPQVPFLKDTSKNVQMYESSDIIEYVQSNYAKK